MTLCQSSLIKTHNKALGTSLSSGEAIMERDWWHTDYKEKKMGRDLISTTVWAALGYVYEEACSVEESSAGVSIAHEPISD